ncbi:hypothetical protein OWV82_015464 [Melia azedarach]|uniref:Uncharacterized protein n=1 Tax=Melia azedarach TaxID=155640 RepID=A0ACC1XRJ0_MELAZ|nr:hypothetical protein OWV82_015464 [Melia azedarach]
MASPAGDNTVHGAYGGFKLKTRFHFRNFFRLNYKATQESEAPSSEETQKNKRELVRRRFSTWSFKIGPERLKDTDRNNPTYWKWPSQEKIQSTEPSSVPSPSANREKRKIVSLWRQFKKMLS